MQFDVDLRTSGVQLRPATEQDREYLWELYVATMKPHVEELWGWDPEWQRAYFETHVDPSARKIILVDCEPAGALEIEMKNCEIFLAALQVAPRFQGRGIGSRLIRQLQRRAREEGRAVTLQVLKGNPARKLYERLGFRAVKDTGSHHVMRWRDRERL